jgi:hypothetical protein
MANAITTIRLDTKLVDEAVKLMKVKSRIEEAVEMRRFKQIVKKYSGKLQFPGYVK